MSALPLLRHGIPDTSLEGGRQFHLKVAPMLAAAGKSAFEIGSPGAKSVHAAITTRIALIGGFTPRRCGIATFTADMYASLTATSPNLAVDVYAMTPAPEHTRFDAPVCATIVESDRTSFAAAAQQINASRVAYRDNQSYFAIMLDDNNRKTICRLYLNGQKKYFAIIDEQKKEVKTEIATIDDIFNFAETLNKIVADFDGEKGSTQ